MIHVTGQAIHVRELATGQDRSWPIPAAPQWGWGSALHGDGRLVAVACVKDGKGLLPVVVEGVDAPGFELTGDLRRVILGRRPDEPGPGREAGDGEAKATEARRAERLIRIILRP